MEAVGIGIDFGSVVHAVDVAGNHKAGAADVRKPSLTPVPHLGSHSRRDTDASGKQAGVTDFDPFEGADESVNALEVSRVFLLRRVGHEYTLAFYPKGSALVHIGTGQPLVFATVRGGKDGQ